MEFKNEYLRYLELKLSEHLSFSTYSYILKENVINEYTYEVISMSFSVQGNAMYIHNISYTNAFFYADLHRVHLGTLFFVDVSKEILRKNQRITYIAGKLSSCDNYNNNWLKSIPFYLALQDNHELKESGIFLNFMLYEDCKRSVSIDVPNVNNPKINREFAKFIKDKYPHRDLYFIFNVRRI